MDIAPPPGVSRASKAARILSWTKTQEAPSGGARSGGAGGLVQGGNRLRRLLARQFGDDLQLEFLAKHGAGRQQADRVFGQELQAPREERGRPLEELTSAIASGSALQPSGPGSKAPVSTSPWSTAEAMNDCRRSLLISSTASPGSVRPSIRRSCGLPRPPRGEGGGGWSVQIAESGDPRRLPRFGRPRRQADTCLPPPPPPCRASGGAACSSIRPPNGNRRESPLPDVPRFRVLGEIVPGLGLCGSLRSIRAPSPGRPRSPVLLQFRQRGSDRAA